MAVSNSIFCTPINQLPEFQIIAGSKEVLEFEVNYHDGKPVNLATAQDIYWCLCRYGTPNYVVLKIKEYEIYDENKFSIQLGYNDTINLSGKYIQQPVVVDQNGQPHRFAQGMINIIPAIN